MIYSVLEQAPVTNSSCCTGPIRCQRCVDAVEHLLGRGISKRPARGFGQPLSEPVYHTISNLGATKMYLHQPAGGQLGLPEINWSTDRATHSQPRIEHPAAVFNSVEDGPVGGQLGLPEMIWSEEPATAKPCGCQVHNDHDYDGPAGGQLGQPEIHW